MPGITKGKEICPKAAGVVLIIGLASGALLL